jgi:hypothetical protein
MRLCTEILVKALSEPDMFGQRWVTDSEVLSVSLVADDHRHEHDRGHVDSHDDRLERVKAGDRIYLESGPLITTD